MPVSSFGDLQYHIDCKPEEELMKGNPEEIYSHIKAALYKLMNTKDQSVPLPSEIIAFIQKECKRVIDEIEPRVNKRKTAKERQKAYEQAQSLGNALTVRCLNEFHNEHIGDATNSAAEEEATTQVSGTKSDEAPQN
ncbi:unnamed protein product [Mucor hiemalis]